MRLNSMTGFGRAEAEQDGRKITIEIKTVNHRYLDINPRMPRMLGFLDDYLRTLIKRRIKRGRVDVFINYYSLREDGKKVYADIPLLKQYIAAVKDAKRASAVRGTLKLEHIVRFPDVFKTEETEEDEAALKKLLESAAEKALLNLVDMRAKEGGKLIHDIRQRLDNLRLVIEKIEKREPYVVEEYREKLAKRLAELLKNTEMDEERFNAEVVYFADKSNITEEIVRLKSHIGQCESGLGSDQPKGRALDFVVQEMNRELNTIGSKTSDIDITNAVLEGKSEVEKIREQVQNIE